MEHLAILKYLNSTFAGNFYLVGGFVRDMLAGIKSEDYDIATDLEPQEIIKIAEKNNLQVIPTGLQHGTVTLLLKGKSLEITTFRKDLSNNGRHAEVKFTKSIKEDSLRRDFTINAIYLDSNGKIYDFHNGQQDLAKGKVKFIGKPTDRIKEDYLRVLRFFRFFADFDKNRISLRDDNLLKALDDLSYKVAELSADRISQELLKMAKSNNFIKAFKSISLIKDLKEMFNLNLLGFVKAELDLDCDFDDFFRFCLINANNLDKMLTNKHYNWSNKQKKLVKLILKAEINLDEEKVIYYSLKYSVDVVRFYIAESYLKGDILKIEANDMLKKLGQELPEFPITGKDLISLGYAENKTLGNSLSLIKAFWLNNNFPDKKSCLDFARKIDKNSL